MTIYRHTLRHAPVGLWQFDGDLSDSSANGHTLTVESGTIWYAEIAPGVRGAYFDGSTQLIYNAASPLLNIQGDLTIEMLVMMISYPAVGVNRAFVSHAASGETFSANFAYEFAYITGAPFTLRFLWEHDLGVNDAYSITSLPALGVLSHLAVTKTSNVVQFYINGNPWGSPSSALTPPNGGQTGRFRVGDATGSTLAPNCVMTSLKVIPKSLSAAEVKAEYGRTLGPQYASYSPPSNLDVVCEDALTINDAVEIPIRYHDLTHSPVGLWQLNGNLNDSSGNGFTLTAESGTERYSEVMPGMVGAYLDGSTVLARNANETLLAITGDYTLEMILLAPTVLASMSIVSHGDTGGTSASNYLWNVHTNATYSLAVFSESGTKSGATLQRPLASISYNAPCHFAVTKTSNVIQFYLNGAVIGTSGSMTATSGGASGKLRLGGTLGTPTMVGCVASLKIVASALNATQVAAEYSRTIGRYYDAQVAL